MNFEPGTLYKTTKTIQYFNLAAKYNWVYNFLPKDSLLLILSKNLYKDFNKTHTTYRFLCYNRDFKIIETYKETLSSCIEKVI